jgi:hypothetical protein
MVTLEFKASSLSSIFASILAKISRNSNFNSAYSSPDIFVELLFSVIFDSNSNKPEAP